MDININPRLGGYESSLEDYGGSPDQTDDNGYLRAGALNSLAEHSFRADKVMSFADLIILTKDSTDANPEIVSYNAIMGNEYLPSVARVSDGVYTITFSTSYDDSFEQTATLNILGAQITVNSLIGLYATYYKQAPNIIKISLWNAGVAATNVDAEMTITFKG